MASAPNGNRFDLHIRRIPGGLFTDGRLPALAEGDAARRRTAARVVLPAQAGFPSPAHGRHRHRARADQEHPRIADGRSRLPAVAALLGHARVSGTSISTTRSRRWGERLPEFEYRPVLSRPGAGWEGRPGYVQDAVLAEIEDLSEYAIYLCGSPEMVAAAKARFIARRCQPQPHLCRQLPLPAQSLVRCRGWPSAGQAIDRAILLVWQGRISSARPPAASGQIAVVFCIRYAKWESEAEPWSCPRGGLGGRWR